MPTPSLPLPIAVLLRRARNAKSPRDRHDTAFAAWEAAVRLAVAARPPRDVERLARATLGVWVGSVTLSEDAEPLRDAAVIAVHALLESRGAAASSDRRSVRTREVLDLLPAYRNDTIGHAAPTRDAAFYDAGFEILAAGLEAMWAAGALLPARAQLVVVEQVEIDAQGRRVGRVLDLTGEVPQVLGGRGGTELAADVLPHRLYLREDGAWRSLHPWVLCRAAERREEILFFSKLDRRAVFLDFESGALVRGDELAADFPGVEDELRRMLGGAPAAESPAAATEGDPQRFGDFRILGKLGEGGMGVVFLARQTSLDRVVALKMLPPGTSDDAVASARFRREMAALSRCDHASVVKILASGNEAGRLWYAMEYVEGADLAAVAGELATSGDLDDAVSSASEKRLVARQDLFAAVPRVGRAAPALAHARGNKVRQLAEAMRDAARGLEHLHDAGIVHRDVKPGNLMLTPERRLVVMDLGLAAMKDASRSLTRDKSAILGTLRYMPPEQLQRSLLEIDERADVYSLGATFYELLTGRALFDGDSEAALVRQVLYDEPTPPRRANPRLPEDLATIVAKCVDKDPRQRYASAAALAEDLQAWLDGRPISARPPSFGYYLALAVRRNRPLAAAVVGLVATLVAALVVSLRLRDEAETARKDAEGAAGRATAATAVAVSETAAKTKALDEAKAALRRAEGQRLLRESRLALDDDPALAMCLALEGAARDPGLDADDVLRAAMIEHRERLRVDLDTSPDSSARCLVLKDRIVTLEGDGKLRSRALATGEVMATFQPAGRLVNGVYVARSGEALGFWSEHTVGLVDANTLELRQESQPFAANVIEVQFAEAGARALVVTRGPEKDAVAAVACWDGDSGATTPWSPGLPWVTGTRLSPDGRTVVHSGSFKEPGTPKKDGTPTERTIARVRLLDATNGAELGALDVRGSPKVACVGYAKGKPIAVTYETGRLAALAVPSGEKLGATSANVVSVTSARLDRDEVVFGYSADTYFWDPLTTDRASKYAAGSPTSNSLVTSPDRRYFVTLPPIFAVGRGSLTVWARRGGWRVATVTGRRAGAFAAAFTADSRELVTIGRDRTLRVWSIFAARPALRVAALDDDSGSGAFTGKLSFAAGPHLIRTFGQGVSVTGTAHFDTANGLATSWGGGWALAPDGLSSAASYQQEVSIYEGVLRSTRLKISPPDFVNQYPLLLANSALTVVCQAKGGPIRFVTYDTKTGAPLHDAPMALAENEMYFTPVALCSGGTLVVGTFAQRKEGSKWSVAATGLAARRVDSATPVWTIPGMTTWPQHIVADRVVLAWPGEAAGPVVLDAKDGRILHRLDCGPARVTSLAISPDERSVLTGSEDGVARIWDIESGRCLHVFGTATGPLRTVAVSADGSRLLTCGDWNILAVWDVASGRPLVWFRSPRDVDAPSATSAALSADGRTAAVAFGSVFVIPVDTAEAASKVAVRELTPEERLTYLPPGEATAADMRAAGQVVAEIEQQCVLPRLARQALDARSGLTPAVRAVAEALLATHDTRSHQTAAIRRVVLRPGRTPAMYAAALAHARELQTTGRLLGEAQFRAGEIEAAIETLSIDDSPRAQDILGLGNAAAAERLAFLTMALQSAGRHEDATTRLKELRETLQKGPNARSDELTGLVAEATLLVEGAPDAAPSDK